MRGWNVGSRIGRVALYAIVVQLMLGGVLWIFVSYEIGVGARWAVTLNDSDFLPPRTGILRTTVRNVFGDAVAGARVQIGGLEGVTAHDGRIVIADVPIGLHEIIITADGYEKYSVRIRINEGDNAPLITYDQGLWPLGFAVDFHVFYAHESQEEQRIFLQVGLANGSDQPMYVRQFATFDSSGHAVAPLLTTPDGYRRLALMHTALSLATEPYALIVKPRAVVLIELPPLMRRPAADDFFHLIVHYGTYDAHRQGTYEAIELVASVQWEPDLSPHRP